ncbi:hypothetical protein [Rubritalea squalenifaciens]|uniref:hypothetical protein n=1 Tax=Rubritalea squalenifaciens TaxID=407226 RepID=UPI001160A8C1|nr:hypothetical protein [Rubritalea squalenifaciens]
MKYYRLLRRSHLVLLGMWVLLGLYTLARVTGAEPTDPFFMVFAAVLTSLAALPLLAFRHKKAFALLTVFSSVFFTGLFLLFAIPSASLYWYYKSIDSYYFVESDSFTRTITFLLVIALWPALLYQSLRYLRLIRTKSGFTIC